MHVAAGIIIGLRSRWLYQLPEPLQIVLHDHGQSHQTFEHSFSGLGPDLQPTRLQGDVWRQVRQHRLTEVGWQGNPQCLGPGYGFGTGQPRPHGLIH